MKNIPLILAVLLFAATVAFAQSQTGPERPYRVPDINGMATLLVKPELPGEAAIKLDGKTIHVIVTVDSEGVPTSVKCSTDCPVDLKAAIEGAAMASRFSPYLRNGKAIEYEGVLLYTFAAAKVSWFSFGTALQSVYIYRNISVGPAAAYLTSQFSEEKNRLLDLDKPGVDGPQRRAVIQEVVNSLAKKVGSKERWLFEVGIALRVATAPTMMPVRMDRIEVQASLAALSRFVDSAPSDISKQAMDQLRTLAALKVDMELPEQDVRRTIAQAASKFNPDR